MCGQHRPRLAGDPAADGWLARFRCCTPSTTCPAAPPRFSAAVRLVNGTGGAPTSGRVELRLGGVWVPVRMRYDVRDGVAATVVCRQLGYLSGGTPVAQAAGAFGPGRNASTLVLEHCAYVTEQPLQQCSRYNNVLYPADGNALAVTCPGAAGGLAGCMAGCRGSAVGFAEGNLGPQRRSLAVRRAAPDWAAREPLPLMHG